ncbi:HNH endonuclease [Cohaesibacter gelatinilyticus]|uniref:HNH endonuclease n=1 Tax=Cohaesibacter gelatinilyticus TaxID=372072 RepID=A0A285PK91_9HYPH|nr:HNH endonuclease signature motif containing protein [Cohaesibacter gelatinilyticus]SNZ21677.1 hypothetical protein SAMN06265368_4802 [Cohaesibacter gelatinilyticus]
MTPKRKRIWDKTGGKCWYCGNDLPEKGWHADHVEPVIRVTELARKNPDCPDQAWKPEREREDNKVPACSKCNLYKSTHSVEEFRELLQRQVELARKASVNFRNAERFGLITVNGVKVTFYFETMESSHG